jgi:molecular chaperone DnaK
MNDVTPLTLSIEVAGGAALRMIERGAQQPVSNAKLFTTSTDNQTAVTVGVYQGERINADDNKRIGVFSLEGIAAAPMGTARIEITYAVNELSIITITAKNLDTGKTQKINISAAEGAERMQLTTDSKNLPALVKTSE